MAEELVESGPLLEAVERWLRENEVGHLPVNLRRRVYDLRHGHRMTLRVADELLCFIDRPELLREIAPPPKGRGGYSWPKPHPLRKLSEAQVEAAHTLHWRGGFSIRELGRMMWERHGYSSPYSCAAALSEAFIRAGLPRRGRVEATLAANDARGRTRNERRRERRAALRASDPAFRAEERQRLDELHERERSA